MLMVHATATEYATPCVSAMLTTSLPSAALWAVGSASGLARIVPAPRQLRSQCRERLIIRLKHVPQDRNV